MSGKPKGRHPSNRLTIRAIEAISSAGRYGDGGGLYLVADHKHAKRWVLRCMVQGSRTDIGLGSYRHVGLSEARDTAREYLRIARKGKDPRIELRASKEIPTFEEAARTYHENNKETWKNAKHRWQWLHSLEQFAFPAIGAKQLDTISTADITDMLLPIWHSKHETATRIKQRCSIIFGANIEHLNGPNPVDNVKHKLKVKRRSERVVAHYRSMSYRQVPEFIVWLRNCEAPSMVRLALEYTVLTACRTGEVIGATWDEIDCRSATWTIPASRMKANEEFQVPLSKRCIDILRIVQSISDSRWVFEGSRKGRHLSNMTMLQFLKRNEIDTTTHGFRSSFRMWAGETTSYPRVPTELCLAHDLRSPVEKAYDRSGHLEKRREIMGAWDRYCASLVESAAGSVMPQTTGE